MAPTVRPLATFPTRPHSRVLPLQRVGDELFHLCDENDEVTLRRLDPATRQPIGDLVRFPAPWPAGYGRAVVAPDGGFAVFTGVHALRAVDPGGALRWEVRHGCWQGACRERHADRDEYADRDDHRYPKRGSAAFSADGRLVWAHVTDSEKGEEWLVLDAADGRVLARAETGTAAEGSDHLPHPTDPRRMWLSVGEGQDGAPLFHGRYHDGELTLDRFDGDDLALVAVGPGGDRLLTVGHDQAAASLHAADGSVLLRLTAEDAVPRHPETEPDNDEAEPYWDWGGAFLDPATVLLSTVEADEEWGTGRHWLLDAARPDRLAELRYPSPVAYAATGLGDGLWWTSSPDHRAATLWTLD